LQEEKSSLQSTIDTLRTEAQDLKTKYQDQSWKVKDAEDKQRKAESATKKLEEEVKKLKDEVKKKTKLVDEKEEARVAAQTELDDLFVVLGDLEDKRTKDKASRVCSRGNIDILTLDRNDSKSLERKCQTVMRTTTKMGTKKRMKMRMKRLRNKQHLLVLGSISYSIWCAYSVSKLPKYRPS
jgi:chromosome segregation ATPase